MDESEKESEQPSLTPEEWLDVLHQITAASIASVNAGGPEFQPVIELHNKFVNFRLLLIAESDRGCALMAAAFLDDVLKESLIANLIIDSKKMRERMFEGNGPLSTFSSRIEIAYAMGLIPRIARRDLHLLRDIRNTFAHRADQLDFSDHAIASQCSEFGLDRRPRTTPPRSRFTRTMSFLLLHVARRLWKPEVPAAPDDFTTKIDDDINALRARFEDAGVMDHPFK